jgi:hypothetical protein
VKGEYKDYGERNELFGYYYFFSLPPVGMRFGRDARCEVVKPDEVEDER